MGQGFANQKFDEELITFELDAHVKIVCETTLLRKAKYLRAGK